MALTQVAVSAKADELLNELPQGDWHAVGTSVVRALNDLRVLRARGEPAVPSLDLPLIIASMIEKLGQPPVGTVDQAMIYSMSAKPLHRALGEAWLSSHPSERDRLHQDIYAGHFQAVLAGRSLHNEVEDLSQPDLPMRHIRFRAVRDEDAGVWTATSDERITSEAATIDALLERLAAIVPDVLESRFGLSGPLRLTVEWEAAPGDMEHKTLAVA